MYIDPISAGQISTFYVRKNVCTFYLHKFDILHLPSAGTPQILCPSTLFFYDPFCTYG
jgi:hypothetical protein